jgi:surfactin synthase thioesterase subunit
MQKMNIRLKPLSPRPMATLRLLCLPFAGAGAGAFRGWADALPAHVEAFAAQLPGREDRLGDAPLVEWPRMLDMLVDSVAGLHPQPTAIFGHSLGALAGYELARRMQGDGIAPLIHVFVSARPWPGATPAPLAALWSGDDAGLLAGMAQRFGTLPASLTHPDIRDVVLPALRGDLRLLDGHRHIPGPPLACPLTVFAGTHDPGTAGATLSGWQSATTGAFAIEWFDGGHFFIESHRRELLAAITSRLPAPARW